MVDRGCSFRATVGGKLNSERSILGTTSSMSVKTFFKKTIKFIVAIFASNKLGARALDCVIETALERSISIEYGKTRICFATPNSLSTFRAESFSSKEPETLIWIDQMPEGSIFWDVGSNVGLYSIYAALARKSRVFSFEPSVFNLELMVRNITLNGVSDLITLVPVALSQNNSLQFFNMGNLKWGGALSSFGESVDQHGHYFEPILKYQLPGFAIDEITKILSIPPPDFLKIDVDGFEHLVLKGGVNNLNSVSSVLIEIDDNYREQSEMSNQLLVNAGLTLLEKASAQPSSQTNQIWKRMV
jgi:FkbM family methyltransferase